MAGSRVGRAVVHECFAELAGTFILVFFGLGAVCADVLSGAQEGIWQVGVVWGVAIALAIYATSALSGTHINPAVTLAFVCFRRFPARKAPLYMAAQTAGAFAAAAALYGLYGNALAAFEAAEGLVRGEAGSERSAMVFADYFPNPKLAFEMGWASGVVSPIQAAAGEAAGTALLGFFVFALTDPRNPNGPGDRLMGVFIGLAVAVIISVLAPLTMAGLNPARDVGPRAWAWLVGWGEVAFPGPRGWGLAVYTAAPLLGGPIGAAAYQWLIRPHLSLDHRPEQQETAG